MTKRPDHARFGSKHPLSLIIVVVSRHCAISPPCIAPPTRTRLDVKGQTDQGRIAMEHQPDRGRGGSADEVTTGRTTDPAKGSGGHPTATRVDGPSWADGRDLVVYVVVPALM